MNSAQNVSHEKLVFAIAVILVVIRLATAACATLNFPWRTARRELHRLVAKWRCLWQGCPNQDNDVVKDQLAEWELQHFRYAITLLTAICSFFCIIHLVNIATSTSRMGSPGQDAAFYTLFATSVLLDMCPKVISNKTINWLFGFFTLITVVAYLPGVCPPQNLWPQIMYANLLFFLLSISRVQVATVAICNALHSVSWSVHLLMVEVPCITFPSRGLVLLQCAWVMTLVAYTWILRQSLQTSFQKDMEAKMLRGEQFAFKALLRMVCDVVIELDPHLRLIGPAQDLSAFLLRGSTQTMEGIPLVEIMPREEDRARVLALFINHDGPRVTHFSLRDGNGTLMEVEMFSFLFEGLDGKSRCFAGLREFSDRAPPAATLSQTPTYEEAMRTGSMTPEPVLMESCQFITLDTGDPHLRIQSISKGLEHLIGATNDSNFIRYLGNSRVFIRWMQEQVNLKKMEVNNDSNSNNSAESLPLPAQTSLEVRLRPRFDWARSHICAVCKLLDDDDDDSSSIHTSDKAGSDMHERFQIHTMRRLPGGFRERSVRSSKSSNSIRSSSNHSVGSSAADGTKTCNFQRSMQPRDNGSSPQKALSGIINL